MTVPPIASPAGAALHRLPAAVKLAGLAVLAPLTFALPWPEILAALLVALVAASLAAGLPARQMARQLTPVTVILSGFFTVHVLTGTIAAGLVMMLRGLALVVAALLVSHTTPLPAMLDTLQRGLEPLRRFGVRPAGWAMMAALTIRFIPELLHAAEQVREAQSVRGLGRNWLALMVPLLIRTLRRAEQVAAALDARGFDPDAPPPPRSTPPRTVE